VGPELVAVLVGAVAGGIIALLGSIAQAFVQGWMSDRGTITCNVTAWQMNGSVIGPEYEIPSGTEGLGPWHPRFKDWEELRALIAGPKSNENTTLTGEYSFTANFLNTKGTNAAVLEYSVEFLKSKRPVTRRVPRVSGLSQGQAIPLQQENVTGISLSGLLDEIDWEVLIEADRVEFTARLSTGKTIRLEVARLS
jgi:hypothetical protein